MLSNFLYSIAFMSTANLNTAFPIKKHPPTLGYKSKQTFFLPQKPARSRLQNHCDQDKVSGEFSASSVSMDASEHPHEDPLYMWTKGEVVEGSKISVAKIEQSGDGCRLVCALITHESPDKEDRIRFFKRSRDPYSRNSLYEIIGRFHGYPLKKIREDQQSFILLGRVIGGAEILLGGLILSGFIPHQFAEWSHHPGDVYIATSNLGLFTLMTDKLLNNVFSRGSKPHNPFYYFDIANCLCINKVLSGEKTSFWTESVRQFIDQKLGQLVDLNYQFSYRKHIEIPSKGDWIDEFKWAIINLHGDLKKDSDSKNGHAKPVVNIQQTIFVDQDPDQNLQEIGYQRLIEKLHQQGEVELATNLAKALGLDSSHDLSNTDR